MTRVRGEYRTTRLSMSTIQLTVRRARAASDKAVGGVTSLLHPAERALRPSRVRRLRQINERLSAKRQRVVRCTGDERTWNQVGDWYLLDLESDSVIATHLDLKEVAESLGIL
jgi:hypothetical protein